MVIILIVLFSLILWVTTLFLQIAYSINESQNQRQNTCNLYLLCNNFKVTYRSVRLGVMIEYFIKVILIVHVNLKYTCHFIFKLYLIVNYLLICIICFRKATSDVLTNYVLCMIKDKTHSDLKSTIIAFEIAIF